MLAGESFGALVKVMLRAREAADELAIILPGNPALLEPAALETLADATLDRVVGRLTGQRGERA
jgi:hypothetical protein